MVSSLLKNILSLLQETFTVEEVKVSSALQAVLLHGGQTGLTMMIKSVHMQKKTICLTIVSALIVAYYSEG